MHRGLGQKVSRRYTPQALRAFNTRSAKDSSFVPLTAPLARWTASVTRHAAADRAKKGIFSTIAFFSDTSRKVLLFNSAIGDPRSANLPSGQKSSSNKRNGSVTIIG